ncbi:MAG: adenylyltransferase/cytidyltransferase family protein [Candidatus Aenigmarchaeota archaeon]|nr:adenylyltransferase/cytidyltransferase family protein [Candidatus Aenigmarchaeota archaeon]
MKVVAISGYFDPLHVGHIRYIQEAKKLGDKLVIILNNDEQAKLKKGFSFMPFEERKEILMNIKDVTDIFESIDIDSSVCKSLEELKPNIFANGGDRNKGNIPEVKICEKNNIELIDNIGGGKIQSSNWLLSNFRKHLRI